MRLGTGLILYKTDGCYHLREYDINAPVLSVDDLTAVAEVKLGDNNGPKLEWLLQEANKRDCEYGLKYIDPKWIANRISDPFVGGQIHHTTNC